MNQNANCLVSDFHKAITELRTIRANYNGTFVLQEPRIFQSAASSLDVVWTSVAGGLESARYPELLAATGRIRQVISFFTVLDLQIVNRAINFHLINGTNNLDALLMSHIALEGISRFVAVEGAYAFPTIDQANIERLTADIEAASALLLVTYKILRDE